MSDEKQTLPADTQVRQHWHRIVVFGDSLSCGPSRYRTDFPPEPPHSGSGYMGRRFTNGWTMVEYMRDRLNVPTSRFHNFATGGETSEDMRMVQFPAFLDYKFDSNLGNSPEHAELFVVFGGSNDFNPFLMRLGDNPLKGIRQYLFGGLSSDLAKLMDDTVARIIHMMDVLYECANARYYFVPNIPNVVSDYPLTKKIFNKYDTKLRKSVESFKSNHSDVSVIIWDLSAAIASMQSRPARFGLNQTNLFKNVQNVEESDPTSTLFIDPIGHFTTKAHFELSKMALDALKTHFSHIQKGDRPADAPTSDWPCSRCSFLNASESTRCEMCHCRKGSTSPRKPVEAASLPTSEWTCSACTLINPPLTLQCNACGTAHIETGIVQKSVLSETDSDFAARQMASLSLATDADSQKSTSPVRLKTPPPSEKRKNKKNKKHNNTVSESHSEEEEVPDRKTQRHSTWACHRCTFLNPRTSDNCEMCDRPFEIPENTKPNHSTNSRVLPDSNTQPETLTTQAPKTDHSPRKTNPQSFKAADFIQVNPNSRPLNSDSDSRSPLKRPLNSKRKQRRNSSKSPE
eukprot:191257_1